MRAIVIEENTLATILKVYPGNLYAIQVLKRSVLRGASHSNGGFETIYWKSGDKIRLATEADFDSFGVKWHPDYAN